MDRPVLNTLGLCTGIGMLEEAIRLGCEYFGWRTKPACLCEWEAYAAAVLMARMEESCLEPCPIWCGDLRDFDARPFRGLVDLLTAGLPCPAYSVAGKQRGLADERAWGSADSPVPQFLRIVSECAPAMVFLENVPPFVRGGHFRAIGEALSRLGYEIECPLFVTASSVGASHKRERVFILAVAQSAKRRFRELWESSRRHGFADRGDQALGDTSRVGRQTGNESVQRSGDQPPRWKTDDTGERRGDVADTNSTRRQQEPGSPFSDEETHGRTRRNKRQQDSHHEPASIDADVENAGSERAGEPRQPENEQPVAQSRGPETFGGRCEPVADTGRVNDRRRRYQRRMDAGPETAKDRRPHAANGTDDVQSDLGDTQQPGPQGDEPGQPQRRGQPVAPDRDRRIFAPGPNADWQGIPAHLYPAIEPGLCVLADGFPLVVDESRADQLRCGGNAVVATCAAVAFVELMRGVLDPC